MTDTSEKCLQRGVRGEIPIETQYHDIQPDLEALEALKANETQTQISEMWIETEYHDTAQRCNYTAARCHDYQPDLESDDSQNHARHAIESIEKITGVGELKVVAAFALNEIFGQQPFAITKDFDTNQFLQESKVDFEEIDGLTSLRDVNGWQIERTHNYSQASLFL